MKTNERWTAERVREELPDVPVRLRGGTVVLGHVRGRKNRFATVYWEGGNCEVSWATLAHILSEDDEVWV